VPNAPLLRYSIKQEAGGSQATEPAALPFGLPGLDVLTLRAKKSAFPDDPRLPGWPIALVAAGAALLAALAVTVYLMRATRRRVTVSAA
jgi:hypothetical protein